MPAKIELPTVIQHYVNAQNEYNSTALSELFTADAIVSDEGKKHHGIAEIKKWNEYTNTKYRTVLEPLDLITAGEEVVLSTSISGNFEGSPVVLNFYFNIEDGKIRGLRIG